MATDGGSLKLEVAVINVEGMTCNSCVRSIEEKIGDLRGVSLIKVILSDERAVVAFDPSCVNQSELRDGIYEMGFGASVDKAVSCYRVGVISIKGMTCNSCVQSIEGKLSELEGVEQVRVSLAEAQACILLNMDMATFEGVVREVYSMGFEASFFDSMMTSPIKRTKSVVIHIEGMTCGSCVKSIESHIGSLPGVETIAVSLEKKEGAIRYNELQTNPNALKEAIYDMGFDATLPDPENKGSGAALAMVIIGIEGMTCNSCVRSIEERIVSLRGVRSISVSLQDKVADVKYDPEQIKAEAIRMTIYEMGFDAMLPENFGEEDSHQPCQTATLQVEGMTCNSCVKTIEGTMLDHRGLTSIKVSLADKSATVTFDPQETTLLAIRDAIYDMGFDCFMPVPNDVDNVQSETITLGIQGMTCNSCVKSIEGKLSEETAIKSVKVSLADENAVVTFDPDHITPSKLRDIVYDMGFDVILPEIASPASSRLSNGPSVDSNHSTVTASPRNLVTQSAFMTEMTQGDDLQEVKAEEDGCSKKCFLKVTGMTCSSCVALIEGKVGKQTGIRSIRVSLMAQKAEVTYDPGILNPSEVATLIDNIGFSAEILEEEKAVKEGVIELNVSDQQRWMASRPTLYIATKMVALATKSV